MKRTTKTIRYHGREGHPVIHTSLSGKRYIMVRAASGKGTRRLYEGSWFVENGKRKRLKL